MFLQKIPVVCILAFFSTILTSPVPGPPGGGPHGGPEVEVSTKKSDKKVPGPLLDPVTIEIPSITPIPVIGGPGQVAPSPSSQVPQPNPETVPTASNQQPTPSVPSSIISITTSVPSLAPATTTLGAAPPSAANPIQFQNSTVIEVPPSNDTRKSAPWQESGRVSNDQSQNVSQSSTFIIIGAIVGGILLAAVVAGSSYYKRRYSQKKKTYPSVIQQDAEMIQPVQDTSAGKSLMVPPFPEHVVSLFGARRDSDLPTATEGANNQRFASPLSRMFTDFQFVQSKASFHNAK